MKVIMNPPYSGLHLKILREAMKHSDDIVNLSPIRWLQDPLAEYKKNSDWYKFEDIRKHIESLDQISQSQSMAYFSTDMVTDLGIYKITSSGGFNRDILVNKIASKVLQKTMSYLKQVDYDKKDGWRVKVSTISGGKNGGGGHRNVTYAYQKLIAFENGMKDGKPWHTFYMKNQWSKETDVITYSFKFNSKEEANNWIDIQNSKLGHYMYTAMTLDQNVKNTHFLWLSDYTHPWTDADLYKYFELTADEIKEIEQCLTTS